MNSAPWTSLNVDRELAVEFMGMFARFEYALKMAGFCSFGRQLTVEWDEFASKVTIDIQNDASGAVSDLQTKPPMKQVLVDNAPDWKTAECSASTPTGVTLCFVRRVRNNLFHGGKFSKTEAEAAGNKAGRDEKLVKASLEILEQLSHDPTIEQFFYY